MNARFFVNRGLIFSLALCLFAAGIEVAAQTRAKTRPKIQTNTTASYRYAYEHGYRAGYEDGFVKGKSDFTDGAPREFENSEAFHNADRTYTEKLGTRIEYQEGYRIGFEVAYNDGYFGRPYSVSIPANLGKTVIAAINSSGGDTVARNQAEDRQGNEPQTTVANTRPRTAPQGRGAVNVPDGVQMKIRLTTQINTKTNREGDRFVAVVLDPTDYAEATIEGHIAKLNRSGKATGKTELSLVFDTIQLRDGRSGRMAAQIEKVYQSETVKTVDEEGNVETGSRSKDTAVRGVGGAALGAIIGGIAGGGKGAAIGAAIGAGAGAGSVFIDGGKDMVLEPGTELLIRTAAPASSQQ